MSQQNDWKRYREQIKDICSKYQFEEISTMLQERWVLKPATVEQVSVFDEKKFEGWSVNDPIPVPRGPARVPYYERRYECGMSLWENRKLTKEELFDQELLEGISEIPPGYDKDETANG